MQSCPSAVATQVWADTARDLYRRWPPPVHWRRGRRSRPARVVRAPLQARAQVVHFFFLAKGPAQHMPHADPLQAALLQHSSSISIPFSHAQNRRIALALISIDDTHRPPPILPLLRQPTPWLKHLTPSSSPPLSPPSLVPFFNAAGRRGKQMQQRVAAWQAERNRNRSGTWATHGIGRTRHGARHTADTTRSGRARLYGESNTASEGRAQL